ncbi:MAG: hypothetical protein ACTTJ7_08960 [Treponema sp.]
MKRICIMLGALFLCTLQLSAQETATTAAPEDSGTTEAAVKTEVDVGTTAAKQKDYYFERRQVFQTYPHAFGFDGNHFFGYGITYQHWFPNGFGFKVIGGGDISYYKRSFGSYNVQVAFQKLLTWSDLFFGWSEAGIYLNVLAGHRGTVDHSIRPTGTTPQLTFKTGGGIGLGIEWALGGRLSFSGEAMMLAAYPLEVTTVGCWGIKFRF